MKHHTWRRSGLRVALIALLALPGLTSCGKKPTTNPAVNLPPTVRLTNAPYSAVDAYYYAITMNWVGNDPDGRVDHYEYLVLDPDSVVSIDPAVIATYPDSEWTRTDKSEQILLFRSSKSDPAAPYSSDFHVFAIRAVDNDGLRSDVQSRSFFSKTEAPTVRVYSPPATSQGRAYVTPAVRIQWDGEDRDGVFTKKPIKYKWKLLTDNTEVNVLTALAKPDSVRRYWAPRNWAGWDSTSSDTTQMQLKSLVPNQEYIFCVVAFDEAGAYSPVFSRDQNMLYFRVTFAGANNPKISFFNEFFFYEYPSGSYEPTNPARVVQLEVPAGQPIAFNWFATPIEGSEMQSYKWAVDIQDLEDNSPRTGPNDLAHWSTPNLNSTSCTIGPYPGSPVPRRFYLVAQDINQLRSLGTIEFTAVAPSFETNLGVIKDTRLLVDNILPGQSRTDFPKGRWPTTAELDTFLFARGGKPYRDYPAGTMSKPGLFSGYSYDTLGTRNGRVDQTVRLSTLGKYQHLIWITDQTSAQNFKDGTTTSPMGALRYMTGRNKANTLAIYLRQGGKVWLVGGGGATAATIEYDRNNNNTGRYGQTFSATNNELVPGRFVYDWAKWQGDFRDIAAVCQIRKNVGRFDPITHPVYGDPGIPSPLLPHSVAAGDSFPPNRIANNADFYYNIFNVEYLSFTNQYQEDVDPGPGEDFRSAIDTLFSAAGSTLPPPSENLVNACMTISPTLDFGPRPQVILTGFDIWSFRKTQCRAILDFVLQRLWGITPTAPNLAAGAQPGGDLHGRMVSSPMIEAAPLPPTNVTPAPTRATAPLRTTRTAPAAGRKSGE